MQTKVTVTYELTIQHEVGVNLEDVISESLVTSQDSRALIVEASVENVSEFENA